MLLDPLRWIDKPGFVGAILRQTYPEITKGGGMWDEASDLYPWVGGQPNKSDLAFTFPSGARIEFGHFGDDRGQKKWQGAQVPLICFDELTHFNERWFWWMLSRNRDRAKTGCRAYMRATCNPDADSWVADFISWWIDTTPGSETYGLPIEERSGQLRWFVRVGRELVWSSNKQQLMADHPGKAPKSVTFVPAKLDDNPTQEQNNPDYRASLEALPYVERMRLLYGNWLIRSTAGAEWEQSPEYFDGIFTKVMPDKFELVAVALDGSKGGQKKSDDYSGIMAVCLGGGKLWVKANLAKRSASKIVADLIDTQDEMQPHVLGVESNGFNTSIKTSSGMNATGEAGQCCPVC